MNFLAISGLVNFISSMVLGFFVISKNRKSSASRSYFILSLFVALFSLHYFLWQISTNPQSAHYHFKVLTMGIILITPSYVLFVHKFLKLKNSIIIWISYALSFVFVYLNLQNRLFSDVSMKGSFGYWPTATLVFNFYICLWLVQCSYGFYLLLRGMRHSVDMQKRNQIKYFLIAAVIGFVGGGTNWPLWYNIYFPPYFNILITLYIGIVAYAILRHNLMDIGVVVKRTAVFAGLFAFIYGVFTLITMIGRNIFEQYFGWNQWVSMIPSVFIITFALRPLETYLTNATEKYLFQKKYDYRDLLKTFTNEVLTVLDLQQLPDQTVAGLVRILKLESASVFLHRKDKKVFEMASSIGVKERGIFFDESHMLISYIKTSGEYILRDKSVDGMETGELKETFNRLNAQLCLPISLHDDLIGILCLGMKKSGEDFTQEDIDILSTLARTEAIAIANAQLFDELSRTQAEAAQREKMAVIGTLAAGINHEICNPLGIVRGQCEMFLLNSRDGFYKDKNVDELLKISSEVMAKVIKETDRATSITKKLSGFAKPSKRSELEEVTVEKEVEEVLGLVGHDLTLNNIDVQKDFPRNFPIILGDRKQVQEVFFNIIRNAAQAMEESTQGRIAISGFVDNGSIVVRIADNGPGIPQDKIAQIFNPFYTTKAPGKGTGLGLFIVKQVVEKNKGTIAVESEVGVGTTFALRFPSATKTMMAAQA